MNARTILAAALVFACGQPAVAAAASLSATLERDAIATRVVDAWADRAAAEWGTTPAAWRAAMAPTIAQASTDDLRRAQAATDLAGVEAALMHADAAAKALGDPTIDLVFVPLTPCRVFDTRNTSRIAADSTRSFAVKGTCGVPTGAAAATVNFTVAAPGIAGFITAHAAGTTRPNAATLNYDAGEIRGNLAVVPLASAVGNDLSVYTFGETHLIADVVGYHIRPGATALECVTVASAPVPIDPGITVGMTSPFCPAGYTIAGGGCYSGGVRAFVLRSETENSTHNCTFTNIGTGTASGAIAKARCCRTPGR